MARTIIPVNASLFGAIPTAIDTSNGNYFDLSGGSPHGPSGIGPLQDKYPLHVIVYNSAGAGTATLKSGYGPWGSATSDLAISIGATGVVDIGPQITKAYSRDAFGSFAIDWTTVAGTVLLMYGNAQTLPGNSAQPFHIKQAPGTLLATVCTATGTANLNIHDDASAANNQVHQVPSSATLGSMLTPYRKCALGIYGAGVANAPGVLAIYV